VANFVLWYPSWEIPARLIGLDFVSILKRLAPTFLSAAAMALAVWLFSLVLPTAWSSAAHLILQITVGAVVYGILVHVFRVEAYIIASRMLAPFLPSLRVR
jgi:hypothetical protein